MVSIEALSSYHDPFEKKTVQYLLSCGWHVYPHGYEKTISKENPLRQDLVSCLDTTSAAVRGRGDYIIFKNNFSSEIEPKTTISANDTEVKIEAMPLAIHIWLSYIGKRCLYVYEHPMHPNEELGFWADRQILSKIERVQITDKHSDRIADEYEQIFNRIFGEEKVVRKNNKAGSGDYFAVIKRENLLKQPRWKSELDYTYRNWKLLH